MVIEMKINLLADLREQVTQDLLRLGCTLPENEPADQLLKRWFDYRDRTISPVPRQIFESPQFAESRSKLSIEEKAALRSIIAKLERGQDVTGHLSKAILDAEKPDLLMADWHIHHIHVGDRKKSPNDLFFERADHLIFAIVNSTGAYLINIYPHEKENWSKSDLLKIVEQAWPDLLKPYQFVGKLEPNVAVSDEQRAELRKAGVYVPTAIGDSIIFSLGGGINAAGFSVSVTRKVNAALDTLRMIEAYLIGYPEIADQFAAELGLQAGQLSIKLEWRTGGICLREERSGKYLILKMDLIKAGVRELIRKDKHHKLPRYPR
jgi:hypothetical protein